MENVAFDKGKFETDLMLLEDPNPSTWWNDAIFRTVFLTVVALEISIAMFCISTDPLTFDTSLFISAQKIQILPVIMAGFRAQNGQLVERFKSKVSKNYSDALTTKDKEITALESKIAEQNEQIAHLDKELYLQRCIIDVRTQNIEALRDADRVFTEVTK